MLQREEQDDHGRVEACGIHRRERFFLDDPDGQTKYWTDRWLPSDIIAKLLRGGEGIKVCAGIFGKGRPRWRLRREQ